MAQVIAEVKRNKLDISGISESRWTRSGRMKTSTGEMIHYSGREDDLHHEGGCDHFEERDREALDGLETSKQQDHSSTFEGQADQCVHHTVLRTYQ